MKHLFQNEEGETVAADTLEQAARHYDCELGGLPEPLPGWSQIPDDAPLKVYEDDRETFQEKPAREWADECDETVTVASTYV